ncbi:hypothetical protein [Paraburkholderia sp. UCT2]|uniref:hypothetical protein n=1 Tax=Paraburkholderia sp. UCT2 TaxID=2615208 RepID=UPI0016558151|nr:hypothetical protein [Paraburkholderia sp. UCT2]
MDTNQPIACPLCGTGLSQASDAGFHYHPPADCILSGFEVSCTDVPRWNRRAAFAATSAEPVADADAKSETLQRVYDLVGMGALARTPGILMTNLENMQRRSRCLSGIENLFTYQVPDEHDEREAADECDLNWGQERDQYVETFKAALPAFIARHPEYAAPLPRSAATVSDEREAEYREGTEHSRVLADLSAGEFKPVFLELQNSVENHERANAAITACALMIKGICLTKPNAEWVGLIEDRIRYMLEARAASTQATAADELVGEVVLFGGDLKAVLWRNGKMPAPGTKLYATPPQDGAQIRDAWRLIETAPKTGSTVLLGYLNMAGKWRTVRGQWMSEAYIAEYWEEPDDVEPGWFETSEEADNVPNCWRVEPTHWMPLPKAPGADTHLDDPDDSDRLSTLLCEIRAACGDNGERERDELVGFIGEVRRDAERYRAFFDSGLPICFCGVDYYDKASLDAAIDATPKGTLVKIIPLPDLPNQTTKDVDHEP